MKSFQKMALMAAMLAVLGFAMPYEAEAQCGARQVDQTNLLLGQELLSQSRQASTSSSVAGCTSCNQNRQSFAAAPQPQIQMFTLPAPTAKRYVLAEVQEQPRNVLYMTSHQNVGGGSSASASASGGSTSASTSTQVADTALPFIAELPPRQSLGQNSTACGGGGCGGRSGLLRRAFSGFGGRRGSQTQTSRSVSRSFTTTTVN